MNTSICDAPIAQLQVRLRAAQKKNAHRVQR
jgi:hypothetical protein